MDKQDNTLRMSEISEICEGLVQILKSEENLYLELIRKEEQKKEAIISRNAESLLEISREQEDELRVVDMQEEKRSNLVSRLRALAGPEKLDNISEIASMSGVSTEMKETILNHSYALRELMLTLKNISGANREILQDNQRLFESLIDEITGKESVGYGPGHEKGSSAKSIFVDING